MLADLGYDGVALTPDVQHLDPFRSTAAEIEQVRAHLERRGLGVTLESGARFLLDPRRKHFPTLLGKNGGTRQQFLVKLLELSRELGSPLVSIWSGARDQDTPEGAEAFDLLAERLKPLLEQADKLGVMLCFEPEPGMLVERIAQYHELRARLEGAELWLTVDTGHLVVNERAPYHEHLLRERASLRNLHLDDAFPGIHQHLEFGDGKLDFPAVWDALETIQYDGPVSVELSRHSHAAPQVAERAIRFLRDL
ncbi:MAG: sugar phosphate isomerase/epimerase family protein [Planctomycetota bacterium]